MGQAPGQVPVSPDEVLAARADRAARQAAALAKFGRPLISVTVVMPGPLKDGWLPRRLMKVVLDEIGGLIARNRWPLLSREVCWRNAGPEAIYVLDVDARVLKLATMRLERYHPIGRLWDLDVITTEGTALSRTELGAPVRRCLLCERSARGCGRSRRHSQSDLMERIRKMVDNLDLHRGT